QLRDFLDQPRFLFQGTGDSQMQRLLEMQAAPEPEASEWEREYRRSLLAWAAQQLRPQIQDTTWQAFWQTAVEGKSGKEVADCLGLTAAAVYLAKSRVMARLRALVREVLDEE